MNMAPHMTLPVLCEKTAECQSVDLWVANKVWAYHLSRTGRRALVYVDVTRVETTVSVVSPRMGKRVL